MTTITTEAAAILRSQRSPRRGRLAAIARRSVAERGAAATGQLRGTASPLSERGPEVPGVRHRDLDLATGVRLHVAEAGAPAAPPLLLVHGWPQHWWAWRGVIPPLAARFRVIAPDLRGFGWSGQPADGDFAKERLADDMLALLDALGLARAGYLGHDWGGWAGLLLAARAPERLERLMVVSILHPWAARAATVRNAWRLAYQLPIAAPVLGPAMLRDGRALRAVLGRLVTPRAAAAYAEVLQAPERAAASAALYRAFLLRELPAIVAGRYAKARIDVPVKLLFPRGDRAQVVAQLPGLEGRTPALDVEVVDGNHFLLDLRPELVADRALAWFG
jgi:pimeloyl-ACP methyl ester carboxylesterase